MSRSTPAQIWARKALSARQGSDERTPTVLGLRLVAAGCPIRAPMVVEPLITPPFDAFVVACAGPGWMGAVQIDDSSPDVLGLFGEHIQSTTGWVPNVGNRATLGAVHEALEDASGWSYRVFEFRERAKVHGFAPEDAAMSTASARGGLALAECYALAWEEHARRVSEATHAE